jgi:hypothetical protein
MLTIQQKQRIFDMLELGEELNWNYTNDERIILLKALEQDIRESQEATDDGEGQTRH